MDFLDVREVGDGFIFTFEGRAGEVDANALGQALLGISEAISRINALLDPDAPIEVYVEALDHGSFKTWIKTKKGMAAGVAGTIILGLLINYISNRIEEQLHPEQQVTVTDEGQNVRITSGPLTIIIPRDMSRNIQVIEEDPKVAESVRRTIEAAQQDRAVTGLSIAPAWRSDSPYVKIRRQEFDGIVDVLDRKIALRPEPNFVGRLPQEFPSTTRRVQKNRQTLVILKAVFERGNRKWQFLLNGTKISAAILDQQFFDDLANRTISIAQGDALDAELSVTQAFLEPQGAWENVHYEVTRVHGVVRGPHQNSLPFV